MSGRPADIRERELSKAARVARKMGAKQIQVNLPGGASIVIPLVPDDDKPAEADEQITL